MVEVTTSNGTIDLTYPPSYSLGGNLHQLEFTYRPGLALLTGYFDGVNVTLAGDSVGNTHHGSYCLQNKAQRRGRFSLATKPVIFASHPRRSFRAS